ncbi:MAG: glycoside hydrolase domain-containing protein, partial [Victivallales bacterium]
MAKPPFCVATVRRSGPITLDGRGDESAWSQAVPLYFSRGDWLPTAEKANVKLLWDSRYLYALFTGMAVKPSLRAKEVSGNDVRVWRKDCFELFIDPGRTQRNYLHFAANAAQGKYDSRHAPGKRDTSYESGWRIRAVIDSDHWTAEAAIPFSALGGTPQPGAVWGFNAGRENSYTEEVSSWSPLDTFHQPRRFGVLLFVTSAYLRQQPLDAGARIARIMYPSHQLEAEADAALKVARAKLDAVPNFSDRVNQAAKQLSTLQHQLANARFFIVYFNAFEQLRDFVAEMSKLKVELIRYAAMFTPGSSGARNGYVASVENSMTKVLPNAYICSGKTQTTLELARNEVGGFQIPLTFQPGYRPKCVTVSVSDLTGTSKAIIPAAAVKSYKVGTIKTAFPRSSHQEELVPDVLFPGHEFAYLDPAPIETLWIDVKVPATAAAGTYHGTITVRPDSKPATSITMRLKVRNFTLPRNSSLKNVFCFRPSQAEIYYGKKMPKWARHNYFDFVIAHRLEPLNLWHRNTKERMLYMSEAELKDYLQRGKNLILVKIPSTKKAFMQWSAPALAMLKRNGWLDKAIMFGFDEVLFHPKRIPEMKKMFAFAKQQASGVPRMITAKIDPILFGVVDIWCPLFNDFDAAEARAREAKGEQVWWYLTDNYPSKPFASLNLDSPGIDPRIIPWMNWKLQITGLLYWNMTSEWKLNGGQQKMIPSKVVKDRGLTWLTPQVAAQVGKSLRWPQIPWIPFFQNIFSKRYTRTNGGGNLMYPGPNWQPLSSIRLKNLRDGMQDYEYFAILQRNLTQLHQHGGDPQLIQQAQAALSLNGKAVQSATSYTKDPTVLLKAKHDIAELIEKTANALQNP